MQDDRGALPGVAAALLLPGVRPPAPPRGPPGGVSGVSEVGDGGRSAPECPGSSGRLRLRPGNMPMAPGGHPVPPTAAAVVAMPGDGRVSGAMME